MNAELKTLHCPRWAELPAIPLYLDQLVMVVQDALAPFAEKDEPVVTKTMINNYVKHKLLTPPEGKKYSRNHIARVIVITVLKRVYSMQEIHALIDLTVDTYGIDDGYNAFCERLETLLAAEDAKVPIRPLNLMDMLDTTLAAVVCKLSVQAYIAKD